VIDAADAVVIEQQRAPRAASAAAAPHRCRVARSAPTVGLDIGGTKVLGVLLDAHGRCSASSGAFAARGHRRAGRDRHRDRRGAGAEPTAR
jgi:hypothetical protein